MGTKKKAITFQDFLKKVTSLLVVLSLAIPQNLLANNPSDDDSRNALPPGRIDYQATLTPAEMSAIGLPPGSTQTLNTSGMHNGQKVDLDVIRGEVPKEDLEKIVKVLEHLKPQIQKAYELDPKMKFEFRYFSAEDKSPQTLPLEAREILEILTEINSNTKDLSEAIALNKVEKIQAWFSKAFNQTTEDQVYWALARVAATGSSSILSFTLASGFPLPTALPWALSLGLASGGVGLFISKYADWLERNQPTPKKGIRNYLSSPETFMFLSPMLIGLQETGVFSVEGVALLGGTAAMSTIIQTVYYKLRNRYPSIGYWYKWYATEAAFLTMPYLMMPMAEVYTDNVMTTIAATYITALLSTMSQGVWEILITKKIQGPRVKEAILRDIESLAKKLSSSYIYENNPEALYKLLHKDEIKAKGRYDLVLDLAKKARVMPLVPFIESLRGKAVDKAIRADLEKQTTRIIGKNIFEISKHELSKFVSEHEFKIRNIFTKYFFLASVVSVASAVATNTGVYLNMDGLKNIGLVGLGALGTSGAITWAHMNKKLGIFVTVLSAASLAAVGAADHYGYELLRTVGNGGLAVAGTGALTWAYMKIKKYKKSAAAAPETKQSVAPVDAKSFSRVFQEHYGNTCHSFFK